MPCPAWPRPIRALHFQGGQYLHRCLNLSLLRGYPLMSAKLRKDISLPRTTTCLAESTSISRNLLGTTKEMFTEIRIPYNMRYTLIGIILKDHLIMTSPSVCDMRWPIHPLLQFPPLLLDIDIVSDRRQQHNLPSSCKAFQTCFETLICRHRATSSQTFQVIGYS